MRKLLLILLLVPVSLFPRTIFRFSGLDRTVESVLSTRLRLDECRRREWNSESRRILLSRMRSLGVFSDVRISGKKEGDDTIVAVSVKEKWTLLPFPMFSTSGSRTMYGAFLMERNVFGLLKTGYGGAMFSKDGVSVLAGFIDPSVRGSRFSWNLFFRYGSDLFEDTSSAGVLFRRYRAGLFSVRGGIGYMPAHGLRVSLFSEYRAVTVEDWADALLPPGSDTRVFSGISLFLDRRSHHDWFAEGLLVRFRGGPVWGGEHTEYETSLRVHWNLPAGRFGRVGLFAAGGAMDLPVTMLPRIGGREGFRVLPQPTVVAREYVTVSLSFEYAVLRFSRATVTALLFTEAGVYRESRRQPFYGPGAGFRFYLKRVALPAMGFDVGWNAEAGEVFAAFSVGMQM